MTHAREDASKAYRISREWPTKSEWIEKYRDGLMAYEIGYEVEEAFEYGAKWAIAHDPVVVQMLANYKFVLGCAENLLRPDKPVHKGLDPTFYHTLTYEGDVELIEKCKQAREALAAYEKEVGE